ncbi:helix-turn-helix domain-containing protein [Streptococcus pantholopis]|nr:LysR family transcriptional regulator [Streptococcus pantholopis]
MVLDHIKEFIVLAKTENYSEAAEQTFISQSSLSKHIQFGS